MDTQRCGDRTQENEYKQDGYGVISSDDDGVK